MKTAPFPKVLPGAMVALLGALWTVLSLSRWFFAAGDPRPGMTPLACGVLLVLLGVAIIWMDIAARGEPEQPSAAGDQGPMPDGDADDEERRELLAVAVTIGAIILFAVLIRPLGLFLATFALFCCVATLVQFKSIVQFVVSYVALAAFVWGVFIFGLRLPIPVLP